MTQIDFYLLSDPSPLPHAVVLCSKAVAAGQRVFVHSPDAVQLQQLSALLWSQVAGSFLSHERQQGQPLVEPLPSIVLGEGSAPDSHQTVLLNLSSQLPPAWQQSTRVLELVADEPTLKAESRKRFKHYREAGLEPTLYEQRDGRWQRR